MDEDWICSFSPKAGQLGTKGLDESLKYIKLKTFEEPPPTRAEIETWILRRIENLKKGNASTGYQIGSECVPRYGNCAETYPINYFANFRVKESWARLPLCGVAIRLESHNCPLEFTFESITGVENVYEQQETGTLSDPCHNCKALLRLYDQELTTFDVFFPLRSQHLKDLDGNLARIEKEKGGGVGAKFHCRDPNGQKVEVPTIMLRIGGDCAPEKREYILYLSFLRDYT